MPYGIQMRNEKYYQSILYLTFKMCGMDISAESMTNIGRVDATLEAGDNIYVIECKIDKTAQEAMNQIEEKRYSEQYLMEKRNGYKIISIGMNFSSSEKNIDDYIVQNN